MNHLMIDLEALGTGVDAPIAAIGAVFFEPSTGCTGARFYTRVDFISDMEQGAKPDGYTIKWWLKQSSEARAELVADDAPLAWEALTRLHDFIEKNAIPNDLKFLQVWGNGASFDCVLLRAAFGRADLEIPWQWWNDRDVRTVVEMGRALGFDPKRNSPFNGERHNALDDAVHQALYVSEIWQRLTTDKEPML
ncbi:3'-5' exonuclease [Serratia liquefaciens]|uniref:3'-5' exoribonuclease n=1 Tax=Serratia liquefaciens TaxID=614 RepID=A0ABX7D6P8_SERLI|nr:3'-5' exonuclease [Serratia liquefaciens]QQU56461.1 3'-5' exoribonuclease [Serratia liquefaciens]